MTDKYPRWYEVDEAHITHFWDGFGISVTRRNVLAVLVERAWEGIVDGIGIFDDKRLAGKYVPEDWQHTLLQGAKWFRMGKNRYMYPVHLSFAEKHWPRTLFEDWYDDPNDEIAMGGSIPSLAVQCPKCRKYRLFSEVKKPLRTDDRCLYCEIRDELP